MKLNLKFVRPDAYNPWGVSIVAYGLDDNNGIYLPSASISFTRFDQRDAQIDGTSAVIFALDNHKDADTIQGLMDSMWQAGIRPSDIGTPGHLAATTKHLEDMRALVFNKLVSVPIP